MEPQECSEFDMHLTAQVTHTITPSLSEDNCDLPRFPETKQEANEQRSSNRVTSFFRKSVFNLANWLPKQQQYTWIQGYVSYYKKYAHKYI